MRIGKNPGKGSAALKGYGRHRVILPIYVPHFEGYFEHALDVLRMSLRSLYLTAGHRAAITIVSNGCAPQVVEELRQRLDEGWFDQLVVNHVNRGKVDAIASVARGCFEPFVTLSDCDVLFRRGWLEAVEGIFQAFPEAGFVSPFPLPALMWHHTTTTLLSALVGGELQFLKVADDVALDRLDRSFGHVDYTPPELRRAQLVVKRGDDLACVGAAHVVCTVRREVLAEMPPGPSLTAIAGGSEVAWFDEPPDRLGFWRLSTPQAFASHMGNNPESWMVDELTALGAEGGESAGSIIEPLDLADARRRWPRFVPIAIRRTLVRQLQRNAIRRAFFDRLGYPSGAWQPSGVK